MSGSSNKYKINRLIIILFSILNIISTFLFIISIVFFFQFWLIEDLIFKEDFYRICHVIRIFLFFNLFSTLFTCYSTNIRSKFALETSSSLQLLTILIATIFYLFTYFSFENYYTNSIRSKYINDAMVYQFILTKYSTYDVGHPVDGYIRDMDVVLKGTKFYIIISAVFSIFTWFFIRLILLVVNKKTPKANPKIVDCANAAMDTVTLNKVRVIST